MSRHVSALDKTVRIIGFSLYLSLIISIISLFFRNKEFSIFLFAASFVYFVIIFAILAKTKNIHFNILMSRKRLRSSKILYKSQFHIAKLRHFRIMFILMMIFFIMVSAFYIYRNLFGLAATAILLAIFTAFYFFVHKIRMLVIEEGLVFDYGEFIVLFQWREIRKYLIKGNHIIIRLKEKNIKRGFYAEHPEKLEKILKKFIS